MMKDYHNRKPAIGDENKKLTPMQERFVEAYFRHGMNIKEASREIWFAKYPVIYPEKGWEMYLLPHVQKKIKDMIEQNMHDMGVTKEHIIQEWVKLAYADITDYIEWGAREAGSAIPTVNVKPSSEVDGKCIKSVKVSPNGKMEIEMYDRMAALKQMGEILGLYSNKVELTGKDGQPIQVEEIHNKMLDKMRKMTNE